ncbi:MAG: dCTP deaminase [bacterium]|nr:dCTP deaminase [bacterium]
MSVLTRDSIIRELESGRLRVEPLGRDQIGPASIDLHLGSELRVLRLHQNGPVQVTDDGESEPETEVIPFERPYVLDPGHTVHGVTLERIFLPPDICGWLEGRSRIARLGLTVHVTSGFVHPGVANHQVLEMSNVSSAQLAIHPGIRICQIVLQRCEGEAVYSGKFADQDSP